jgi:hypothetical protein
MTPKEKAIELIDKFIDYVNCWDNDGANYTQAYNYSKQCALIAVDETIRTLNEDIRDLDVRGNVLLDLIDYWREVKQEIEKL